MRRWRLRVLVLLACALHWTLSPAAARAEPRVVVGAKQFTESTVLAELMAQVLERYTGMAVERRFNLGGTNVAFDALRRGEVDLYAEYTGTGLRDILHDAEADRDPARTFARVSSAFERRYDLIWLAPFGFNNSYVLMMRRDRARSLGIGSISEAAPQPLRYGLSHEFLQRPDGMPGLQDAYALRAQAVVGMAHDLAYQALADGAIDVADGYSTDAKILHADLIVLRDDKGFFPPYEAAPLVRRELLTRAPGVAGALALLAGRIDENRMRELNREVEQEHRSPEQAAAIFLSTYGIGAGAQRSSAGARSFPAFLWERRRITLHLTWQHLVLTGMAEGLACLLAIPLGVAASRHPRLSTAALGTAGILQTIPSIALLALMLPLFGIGARPAIVALFLYGLLPILRNTVAAVRGLDPTLLEVGRGLGMRPRQLFLHVELPLATPVILAGVRTSAVISIGTATLAAFIGAGGLGDPIVSGLASTDTNLILSGAVPAALLAIAVDGGLGWVERRATPRGVRLAAQRTPAR